MTSVESRRRITICGYCRKRVYRQLNGAWYHRRNGSASCYPGQGSDKRAIPLEITVRRDAGEES